MLAANPKLAQWEEQKRLQKRIDGLRGKVQVVLQLRPSMESVCWSILILGRLHAFFDEALSLMLNA